ncbi:uncharacterized protein PHA67_004486 [Liasis olivaceus]
MYLKFLSNSTHPRQKALLRKRKPPRSQEDYSSDCGQGRETSRSTSEAAGGRGRSGTASPTRSGQRSEALPGAAPLSWRRLRSERRALLFACFPGSPRRRYIFQGWGERHLGKDDPLPSPPLCRSSTAARWKPLRPAAGDARALRDGGPRHALELQASPAPPAPRAKRPSAALERSGPAALQSGSPPGAPGEPLAGLAGGQRASLGKTISCSRGGSARPSRKGRAGQESRGRLPRPGSERQQEGRRE